jgi:hypothetical protein
MHKGVVYQMARLAYLVEKLFRRARLDAAGGNLLDNTVDHGLVRLPRRVCSSSTIAPDLLIGGAAASPSNPRARQQSTATPDAARAPRLQAVILTTTGGRLHRSGDVYYTQRRARIPRAPSTALMAALEAAIGCLRRADPDTWLRRLWLVVASAPPCRAQTSAYVNPIGAACSLLTAVHCRKMRADEAPKWKHLAPTAIRPRAGGDNG